MNQIEKGISGGRKQYAEAKGGMFENTSCLLFLWNRQQGRKRRCGTRGRADMPRTLNLNLRAMMHHQRVLQGMHGGMGAH